MSLYHRWLRIGLTINGFQRLFGNEQMTDIDMQATRRGIPYETDMLSISWKLTHRHRNAIFQLTARLAKDQLCKMEQPLITVDCEIFDTEKAFQEKLEDITNSLQSNYDLAIANHKL